MFAATDSHGYLILYGYENTDKYANTPTEQFFHTDYRPLSRDRYNRAIDKKTGIETHLLPPSILLSASSVPYKVEVQRLIQGLENITEAEYSQRIVQNGDGSKEVIDDCDRQNNQGNIKYWVKNIIEKLDAKEIEKGELVRIENLAMDEKYFNEEFGELEIFKDSLNSESLNRKRRDRNKSSIESNDDSDNSSKMKSSASGKTRQSYRRIVRPNDSDEIEQSANNLDISNDTEFGDVEESSEDDENDFIEDDDDEDFQESDTRPSTSRKKRKVYSKIRN